MKFSDARLMGNFNFVKPNPYLKEWRAKNGGGLDLLLGKRLFYCDILYDMAIRYDSCDEIIEKYEASAKRMRELYEIGDENKEDYHYAYLIYEIGKTKAELCKNLRARYKQGDRAYLEKASYEIILQLKNGMRNLRLSIKNSG